MKKRMNRWGSALIFAAILCVALLSACKKENASGGEGGGGGVEPAPFVPATLLEMKNPSLSSFSGTTFTMKTRINVEPEDATLSWFSSKPEVATVDANGWVKTLSGGQTTIEVSSGEKRASCTLTVTKLTNLSAGGAANCYIVSEPGYYRIDLKKGTSDEYLEGVSNVEVLWESFGTSTAPQVGDIVNVYTVGAQAVIFNTSYPMKTGNAVVAAKDASDKILWSWHIWSYEGYDPFAKAQTYANGAGTMMDRNLGATSTTPGAVGALGLMYQWGRKDPFLGCNNIASSTKAASTLSSWPTPVQSNAMFGTIDYVVANPTTFIKYNSMNYDWCYTGDASTDNTRWQSTKTLYDPCPPGWRIPDGGNNGVWAKAAGTDSFANAWDSTNKGMDFSGEFGSSGSIWYPASGDLGDEDGSLYNVGGRAFYASCTPKDNLAYGLQFSGNGMVNTLGSFGRALGVNVRCFRQ